MNLLPAYSYGSEGYMAADGNQRERGEVAFALPDQCGRPALSGVCHESALNGSVRDSVVTVRYVGWWGGTYTGENVIAGYATALSLPYPEISEVNYYDDYSFLEIQSEPAIPALAAALEARGAAPARDNNTGLLTGRLTGVPDPDFYGNGGERSAGTLASAILYDSASRPSRTIETGLDGTVSDETVTYSVTDKPLSRRCETFGPSGSAAASIEYAFTYDGLDRLVRTEATVGGVTKTLAEDAYDTFGRLTSTRLGPGAAAVSYGYATRGALKSISAPRFSQTLLYTEGEIPCYGGNISASLWRGLDGISRRYDYSYDPSGRLVKADYTESGRDPDIYKLYRSIPDYSAYYTYDLNSNPATTYRYGVQDKSSDDECVYLRFGMIDDLVFHREGNRLTAVVDDGSSAWYVGATDFADDQTDADEYLYDANGNMTYDLNRGIESITYNDLNLPAVITMKGGETIRNHYDAAGRLLRRQTLTNPASGSPSLPSAPVLQEDEETFIGGFIFNTGSGGWRLRQINTPAGYIAGDGHVYSFVRDYQGNVRQVVNERGGVVQESDYYPYGMLFGESDVSGSRSEANRYRYGGKEYLSASGLNLYDFTARYLDPAMGAFLSSDPMQSDYKPLSPTLYCGADPVNRVDPSGMRFEYNLSPEDFKIFISNIQAMCKSKEFDTLFKYLDKSGTVYEISFEDLDDDKVAYVDTNNPDNIRIVFSKQRISYFTLGEEFFHAYQYESSDWYRLAEVNKEFEAQSFSYFIYQVIQEGSAPPIMEGALDKTLFSDCFDSYGNYIDNLKSVVNKDGFASHYKKSANKFVQNAINSPTRTNENYKMPNNSAPVGILLLVNILMKLLWI